MPPCLLVAGVVLGLDFLLVLSDEAQYINQEGNRTKAILSILYTEPYRLYQAMPMILLLGTLIGLGGMANHNELNVLRAAGVSLSRLAIAVLLALAPLIVFNTWLGEYGAPAAQRQALVWRAELGSSSASQGFWLKEQNTFAQVKLVRDQRLEDITLYQYQANQWQSTLWAKAAYFDTDQWILVDGYQLALTDQGLERTGFSERPWPIALTTELVAHMGIDPEYLALQDLYQHTDYLRKSGINGDLFVLSFWKKIYQPFFTVALILVAMSFVFGSQRTVPVSQRVMFGAFLGLGFNYSLDILGPASRLFGLSTPLAYGLPIVLCLILAWRLFKRVN